MCCMREYTRCLNCNQFIPSEYPPGSWLCSENLRSGRKHRAQCFPEGGRPCARTSPWTFVMSQVTSQRFPNSYFFTISNRVPQIIYLHVGSLATLVFFYTELQRKNEPLNMCFQPPIFSSPTLQFTSVAQSCLTLRDPAVTEKMWIFQSLCWYQHGLLVKGSINVKPLSSSHKTVNIYQNKTSVSTPRSAAHEINIPVTSQLSQSINSKLNTKGQKHIFNSLFFLNNPVQEKLRILDFQNVTKLFITLCY